MSAITIEAKTFYNRLAFERGLWLHSTMWFCLFQEREFFNGLQVGFPNVTTT